MSTIPDPLPLSHHQHSKLEELVTRTGKPWESVLDEALEVYAEHSEQEKVGEEDGESFYDAAMRLGLRLGSIDDLPPDLSTNPKYMEGFGLDTE